MYVKFTKKQVDKFLTFFNEYSIHKFNLLNEYISTEIEMKKSNLYKFSKDTNHLRAFKSFSYQN